MKKNLKRIRVCLAGATGWAGSTLAKGIFDAPELELVSAISRSYAGKNLGKVLDIAGMTVPIFSNVPQALATKPEVFFEYTGPDTAKRNVMAALAAGSHVVVGTSGLHDKDFEEIERFARRKKLGVLAVGNFALGAVLLQKFAEMAAQYVPHWEIIDYARSQKVDAPSGTARQLANRLSLVRAPKLDVPLAKTRGAKESRGAQIAGSQVHAVRLPGYVISVEALFGLPDERLSIKHDCGASSLPYVAGALLAIKEVSKIRGLERGLDRVMKLG